MSDDGARVPVEELPAALRLFHFERMVRFGGGDPGVAAELLGWTRSEAETLSAEDGRVHQVENDYLRRPEARAGARSEEQVAATVRGLIECLDSVLVEQGFRKRSGCAWQRRVKGRGEALIVAPGVLKHPGLGPFAVGIHYQMWDSTDRLEFMPGQFLPRVGPPLFHVVGGELFCLNGGPLVGARALEELLRLVGLCRDFNASMVEQGFSCKDVRDSLRRLPTVTAD
jgi:hypothetical protein